MSQIVIEYDDGNNGDLAEFAPAGAPVRGFWTQHNHRPPDLTSARPIREMPAIPGMQIIVDEDAKKGTVHDPLNKQDSQTKELLATISRVHKRVFGTFVQPCQDREFSLADPTKSRTWLWMMRRLVDNGQARVVAGELPEMDKIVGDVETNKHDWSDKGKKKVKAESLRVAA